MANHTGSKGPPWTASEEATLRALMPTDATQRQMAEIIGRSVGAICGKINNIRMADKVGPSAGPFLHRFQTPAYRVTDEYAHLSLILAADPNGFRWLRPGVAARFYALEHAAADKSWWRAA